MNLYRKFPADIFFKFFTLNQFPRANIGKGIGNSLLTFAEQKAKGLGCKEIIIWAFKENVHALSFYQKLIQEMEKNARKVINLLHRGIRFTPTQPDGTVKEPEIGKKEQGASFSYTSAAYLRLVCFREK